MHKHHYRISIDIWSDHDLSGLYPIFRYIVNRLSLPGWILVEVNDMRAIGVLRRLSWWGKESMARGLLQKIYTSWGNDTAELSALASRIDIDEILSQE